MTACTPSRSVPRRVLHLAAPDREPAPDRHPRRRHPDQDDPNPPPPTQPTALALWNERRADGDLVACRAIRLGGRAGPDGTWHNGDVDQDGVFDAGFVSIGEIDYRIMLRYAQFDPLGLPGQQGRPGIGEPSIPDGLRAADVPGGCQLYIVSFWTEVIEEFREALRASGATILSYLPDHANLVRMDVEAMAHVVALTCVRWVGPFHPVYRIDPARAAVLARAPPNQPPSERYNIQVFGPTQLMTVADRVAAVGGTIELIVPDGYMLSATLTLAQLREVVRMNDVTFASLWGPPRLCMDKVRAAAGAEIVHGIGFTGTGVRAEVMDDYVQRLPSLHQDFETAGVEPHGPIVIQTNPAHGT